MANDQRQSTLVPSLHLNIQQSSARAQKLMQRGGKPFRSGTLPRVSLIPSCGSKTSAVVRDLLASRGRTLFLENNGNNPHGSTTSLRNFSPPTLVRPPPLSQKAKTDTRLNVFTSRRENGFCIKTSEKKHSKGCKLRAQCMKAPFPGSFCRHKYLGFYASEKIFLYSSPLSTSPASQNFLADLLNLVIGIELQTF
jgi:hypothetical protein